MKSVSPAATYVSMIPLLTEAARDCGYALAVHGTMARDLDLIAVPWTPEASSAEQLILRLLSAVSYCAHLTHRNPGEGHADGDNSKGDLPSKKPHGRLSWTIIFDGGGANLFLDVSVMPRIVQGGTP